MDNNQRDADRDNSVGREGDARFYTADSVLIRHGLRVWDNDLAPVTVHFTDSNPGDEDWDGWFEVINDRGRVELVNGERMATTHPFTRQPPPPPPADPDRETLVALTQAGVTVCTGEQDTHAAVTYRPRVDGDPTPWTDPYHRRFTTSEVVAHPDNAEELRTYLMATVPQLQALELTLKRLGSIAEHIEIDMIRIAKDERGNNHGERVLTLLTEWADQHGMVLTVTPDPAALPGERAASITRLRRWFRRHGFIRNGGRRPAYSDSMFRDPRTQA